MLRATFRVGLLLLSIAAARAQPVALSVNTRSREEVRQFFRAVYSASENVPMTWTGDYVRGTAGDTSSTFKEATRLRLNFFRALAGVPADVTFNPDFNARAQQTALLMSVNQMLSHTPAPNWRLYSAVAADGARHSNLALGQAGPDAINSYIADAGQANAAVGHRRWLFYPQTLQMGTGDVPGVSGLAAQLPANALWVFDHTPGGEYGARRPLTRHPYVAYPPAGYIPYSLVWPRWSFSHPDADFSAATVTLTLNGKNVPVQLEPLGTGFGEPTLVWTFASLDSETAIAHERPARDATYRVNIERVRIGDRIEQFTYQVTVFDPDVPGRDAAPTSITGSISPILGTAETYVVHSPSFAPSIDWRTLSLLPTTPRFTAESGLEGLVPTIVRGYDIVQSHIAASGDQAYRLAHLDPRSDQVLLVPGTYFVAEPEAAITFRSRLGIATATETARVQISTDDGASWIDVFAQSGTSPTDTPFPAVTETDFVHRAVFLTDFVGRTVNVRLVYSIGLDGAFMPEPANAVGWFIDDLVLTGLHTITTRSLARLARGSPFTLTATSSDPIALQARGVVFDAYPLEWGTITQLTPVAPASTSALPASP